MKIYKFVALISIILHGESLTQNVKNLDIKLSKQGVGCKLTVTSEIESVHLELSDILLLQNVITEMFNCFCQVLETNEAETVVIFSAVNSLTNF